MARKTIKAGGYDISDVALGLQRQLLSFKKNGDDIRYRYQSEEDTTAPNVPTAPEVSEVPTKTPLTAPTPPVQANTQERAASSQRISFPDKPITAVDLVKVVVAVTLKKSPEDIAQDQTIKALGGGESQTLGKYTFM